MITMKKYKVVFISILFLLLTGCSVEYNLNIKDDLSIEESADIEETYSFFEENYTYYNSSEVLDLLWQQYSPEYADSAYTYTHNLNETGINVKATYSNIDEYIDKAKVYKQVFENVSCEKNGNVVTLRTTGQFYKYNTQDPERFPIDSITLNIFIPYDVRNTNADNIDGNKYTWYILKDTKDKKIEITFDISKKKEQINNNEKNYLPVIVIIAIIICILICYIIYRVNKNDDSF